MCRRPATKKLPGKKGLEKADKDDVFNNKHPARIGPRSSSPRNFQMIPILQSKSMMNTHWNLKGKFSPRNQDLKGISSMILYITSHLFLKVLISFKELDSVIGMSSLVMCFLMLNVNIWTVRTTRVDALTIGYG
jgi:hypothetical protein